MLSFRILQAKPFIGQTEDQGQQSTYERGFGKVDMTRSTYNPNRLADLENIVFVSDRLQMRPDLVSKSIYDTDEITDMMLAFNNYSNPFAIDEGDIFFMPEKQELQSFIVEPQDLTNKDSLENVSQRVKEANQDGRFNPKNQAREKFLQNKQEEAAPPPNVTTPDQPQRERRDGRIIFGNNVSEKDCVSGNTDAEIKSEIIKRRVQENYKRQFQNSETQNSNENDS